MMILETINHVSGYSILASFLVMMLVGSTGGVTNRFSRFCFSLSIMVWAVTGLYILFG